MKHSYKTTFDALWVQAPSADLAQRIETEILRIEAGRARRKAYSFAVLTIVALAAFVPALQYALGQTSQSGLYEYMSLFVSDSGYVFAHMREVMMTIVESVPLTGIVLTLAALLITAYAAEKSASYIRSVRHRFITISI